VKDGCAEKQAGRQGGSVLGVCAGLDASCPVPGGATPGQDASTAVRQCLPTPLAAVVHQKTPQRSGDYYQCDECVCCVTSRRE